MCGIQVCFEVFCQEVVSGTGAGRQGIHWCSKYEIQQQVALCKAARDNAFHVAVRTFWVTQSLPDIRIYMQWNKDKLEIYQSDGSKK